MTRTLQVYYLSSNLNVSINHVDCRKAVHLQLGVIVYKNITTGADFQVSNNGRTLTFARSYNLAGVTFRCQVH